MRQVVITRAAASDLASARQWLTQDGAGHRAAQRLEALTSAIQDLRRAPFRWALGDHDGVRERQVGGYRIAYEVAADQDDVAGDVTVLRVFGPGQNRTDPRSS